VPCTLPCRVQVQPTSVASGASVTFSCSLASPLSSVSFYIGSTLVGFAYEPVAPLGDTGGGLYAVSVDVSGYPSTDGYVFKVVAIVGSQTLQASKYVCGVWSRQPGPVQLPSPCNLPRLSCVCSPVTAPPPHPLPLSPSPTLLVSGLCPSTIAGPECLSPSRPSTVVPT
jgi:hypothetical protein